MLQLPLRTSKETKKLSSEDIIVDIEFNNGDEELLRHNRGEGALDLFKRHSR